MTTTRTAGVLTDGAAPEPTIPRRQGTFSVVVPCYNYGRFLPECVRSIVDQPDVVVDVLIIDDCSTDDSTRVAKDLSDRYVNVSVICHDVNRGHIATYNEGIDWACGDYFILLSADDLLAAGSLERARTILDEHPNVGLVYGPVAPFATQAEIRERSAPGVRTTISSGRRWVRRFSRVGENLTRSPEIVLRTSVQKAIGYYDPALGHAGDMHMWLARRRSAMWRTSGAACRRTTGSTATTCRGPRSPTGSTNWSKFA